MKRSRAGGSLTGGTGDVSPQWLSFSATQSGADATTTTTQSIPVQRQNNRGIAQVMEVLKVIFNTTALPASATVTETLDAINVFLTTTSFGTTPTTASEPRVFAFSAQASRSAFTAGGTYFTAIPQIQEFNCNDGAGHGILVATDNIFAQVSSTATGNTNTAHIKIMYRWKNVSLQEYIGIVQSQQ